MATKCSPEVFLQVFEADCLLPLIAEFQNGAPMDIKLRMEERYQTIIMPGINFKQKMPLGVRQLVSFPDNVIDSWKLSLSNAHRDVRFAAHLAIAEGDLEFVQRLFKYKPHLFTTDAIYCALTFHQYGIVKWLYRTLKQDFPEMVHDGRLFNRLFSLASSDIGNDVVLQDEWLENMFEEQMTKQAQTLSFADQALNAFQAQDLDGFRVALIPVASESIWAIMRAVAVPGQLEFIDAFFQGLTPKMNSKMMRTYLLKDFVKEVVKHGHVHVLEWLVHQFETNEELKIFAEQEADEFMPTSLNWRNALVSDKLDVMKWIHEKYPREWSEEVVDPAVPVDDLAIVEFLHEIHHPLDGICPFTLQVAEFLIDHGVEITPQHLLWAVGARVNPSVELQHQRQLDVSQMGPLVQLYHERCPHLEFDVTHVNTAAEIGSVSVIQFLHENKLGSFDDPVTMHYALVSGSVDTVKYLHEVVGCPFDENAFSFALESVLSRDGEVEYLASPMLQYVVSHGKDIEWNITSSMFNHCTQETLHWLLSECKNSQNWPLLEYYVRFGRLDYLESITGCSLIDTTSIKAALARAIEHGSINLLNYLWNLFENRVLENNMHPEEVVAHCGTILAEIQKKLDVIYPFTQFYYPWENFHDRVQETRQSYADLLPPEPTDDIAEQLEQVELIESVVPTEAPSETTGQQEQPEPIVSEELPLPTATVEQIVAVEPVESVHDQSVSE